MNAKVEASVSRMTVWLSTLLFFVLPSHANAFQGHPSRTALVAKGLQMNEREERSSEPRALWVQVGLGVAMANKGPGEYIHADMSLHFRYRNQLFSIGMDANGTECWGIDSMWGAYGYSLHDRLIDIMFSSGIAFTQWYHDTESIPFGTIRSRYVPGILLRFQALPHFRFGLGTGVVITFNYNNEARYHAVSLVLALGHWNW